MPTTETHLHRIVAYTANSWESPLATLRLVGPVEQAGLELVKGNLFNDVHPERVSAADLVIIQRDFPRYTEAYQEVIGRARLERKPVVYDLDDLLLELPEDHPDQKNFYYCSALVPMLQALTEADLVTTSSPTLCAYVRHLNPNVVVAPNYLNDRLWELRPPLLAPAGQPVVVGYMGGDSHLSDLEFVAPALLNLLKRFRERMMLRFLGAQPPPELLAQPNVRWAPVRTLNYAEFAGEFGAPDYDLFIAPLKDNLFNRCKSPIKFLEYSAAGAPGVYSHLETYAGVVVHGENGYLATSLDEWEEYIAHLVEDPAQRYAMALQAQETVRREWLLSQRAGEFGAIWQSASCSEKIPLPARQPEVAQILRVSTQVQEWSSHLAGRLADLEAQAKEQENELQANRAQLAEQAEAVQYLNEIYGSRAWRLIRLLWKVRLALAPHGSRREQLLQLGLHSLKVIKNEGLAPFARAVGRKTGSLVQRKSRPAVPASTSFPPPEQDSAVQAQGRFGPALQPSRPTRYDVIILPIMPWYTRVQRPQHLARCFAGAGHRVFYIDTLFRPGSAPLIQTVHPNVFEVQLPAPEPVDIYRETMPEGWPETLQAVFAGVKYDFDISEAVCLVDLPFWTPLALRLRQEFGWKIVYDCMDFHAGFSTSHAGLVEQERILAQASDLVLVTSRLLFDEKAGQNPNCVFVPNGADFDHFRFPPPQLKFRPKNPRPVIGYYGAIADWFDTGLIRKLALARPEWDFLLIGSTLYADIEPVKDLKNVTISGEVPYPSLPQYLHTFDVAIIPFKQIPLTQATNPVKLFEYLSAGKPVVATELNELQHYAGFVRLATSQAQWLAALEAALDDTEPAHIQARFDFARQNTWEVRFALVRDSIQVIYPLISIVIVTYNNLDYTRMCLHSIFTKTLYPNYEIVIVDNASTDGTRPYLEACARTRHNLHLIFNPANEGFARANNSGAAAAAGQYIVFLNNDTVVTCGWLSGLVRHLQDPAVGMVGPVTNFSGNESLIPVTYTTLEEMDAFALEHVREHAGESFEIRMLAFYCAMLRRPVFEEIGPLDEGFGIGMFEDDDYALRLKRRGYRIVCAEDVFIHHWGSASFSALDRQLYQRLFETNLHKFEAKWGIRWEPHHYRQPPAVN